MAFVLLATGIHSEFYRLAHIHSFCIVHAYNPLRNNVAKQQTTMSSIRVSQCALKMVFPTLNPGSRIGTCSRRGIQSPSDIMCARTAGGGS